MSEEGITMKQLKAVIANPLNHPRDPQQGEIKLLLGEILEQLKLHNELLKQLVDLHLIT